VATQLEVSYNGASMLEDKKHCVSHLALYVALRTTSSGTVDTSTKARLTSSAIWQISMKEYE